jgi:hypothetical protein
MVGEGGEEQDEELGKPLHLWRDSELRLGRGT